MQCSPKQVLQVQNQDPFPSSSNLTPSSNRKHNHSSEAVPQPKEKLCPCSPRCVDPDDIQVTEVDAFFIQPAIAGTSLGPRVRSQGGLQRRVAHTVFQEDAEGEHQQQGAGGVAGHGAGLTSVGLRRKELEVLETFSSGFLLSFPHSQPGSAAVSPHGALPEPPRCVWSRRRRAGAL